MTVLHYRGDRTDSFPADRLLSFGDRRYLPESVKYDGAADLTTVQLRRLSDDELNEFFSTRRDDTIDRLLDRLQVAELFGGRP